MEARGAVGYAPPRGGCGSRDPSRDMPHSTPVTGYSCDTTFLPKQASVNKLLLLLKSFKNDVFLLDQFPHTTISPHVPSHVTSKSSLRP